jgi:SAM-dependent methyltransferase
MELTGFAWDGVDPRIDVPSKSENGASLQPGTADQLPFEDGTFDVLILANVFEHILPDRRVSSMAEMRRVLAPGGVIVGQIPNPYFPIESHSRLPFMGWLPMSLQLRYWRLSPTPWDHDFFVVTPKHVRRDALAGGLKPLVVRNFNYPLEVIPENVRWAAKALARPMQHLPWAWQFVLGVETPRRAAEAVAAGGSV